MMSRSSKTDQRAARAERLRAAMRENLRRRKAQVRGRARDPQPARPHESNAGEAAGKADASIS